MIRVSRMANYGIILLSQLDIAGTTSAHALAERSGIPYPTVAKVLKYLATNRVLSSRRGVSGGYQLARPLAEISVFDVITAIDGPLHLITETHAGHAGWHHVEDKIASVLRETTVPSLLS